MYSNILYLLKSYDIYDFEIYLEWYFHFIFALASQVIGHEKIVSWNAYNYFFLTSDCAVILIST